MKRLALLLACSRARRLRIVAGSPSASPRRAASTVALDFAPNPVHAPIYMAGDALTDPQARLRARTRSSSWPAGKVDLGVLDIHDLAIAREQGSDLVAVGALVGKPLAALIAQPDVGAPARPRGPHRRRLRAAVGPGVREARSSTDDGGDSRRSSRSRSASTRSAGC